MNIFELIFVICFLGTCISLIIYGLFTRTITNKENETSFYPKQEKKMKKGMNEILYFYKRIIIFKDDEKYTKLPTRMEILKLGGKFYEVSLVVTNMDRNSYDVYLSDSQDYECLKNTEKSSTEKWDAEEKTLNDEMENGWVPPSVYLNQPGYNRLDKVPDPPKESY